MKESKDRTEQFMHSTSAAAAQAPSSESGTATRPLPRVTNVIIADSLLFGNTQRPDPMGDGSRLAPRFDPKGKSRASTPSNGDILALDLGTAEEGASAQNGDAFMQMQLVEQQVSMYSAE